MNFLCSNILWTSIISGVNNHILTRCTFRDPSHFELIELMSAIFVILVQITMLLMRFNFRYWRQPIRMHEDRHEQFVLKMRCDYLYHLWSIINCEDQQPSTGPNLDHVTDSIISWPISASNWARKSVIHNKNPHCNSEKQNVSSR